MNTINIPGYVSVVNYGLNFGFKYIIQDTYHFTDGSEIAFYNRHLDQLSSTSVSTVAVWRIKSIN